jgi:hypothetical protein
MGGFSLAISGETVMLRVRRFVLAALAVAAGLLLPRPASAESLKEWLFPQSDTSYSAFRYWTPGLARVHDDCHGPRLNPYAPDRHPEITPTYIILKFPCPAVDAAATIIEPPTPPATSRFKY